MGFRVRVPGVRVSKRGVRVGPRVANVGPGGFRGSVGGRIGFSYGSGGSRGSYELDESLASTESGGWLLGLGVVVATLAVCLALVFWIIIARVLGILLVLSLVALYARWRGLTQPHTSATAFCPQRSCKKHLADRARRCEMCGKPAYRPPEEIAGTKQKIPGDVLLSMAVAADMALIGICTVLASTEYDMGIKDTPNPFNFVVWEPFGWGRMLAPAVVTAAVVVGAAVFVQRSQRIKGVGWHPQCARVHRLTARFCDWTGKPLANEWMDGRCAPREQVLKHALFVPSLVRTVGPILQWKTHPRPPIPGHHLAQRITPFLLERQLHLVERLEVLLDSGHLSVEEFADHKTQLLSS